MATQFLSVLCADVTGGKRLFEKLTPSEANRAVGRCEKRIAQIVEGFHGRLSGRGETRMVAYFTAAEDALLSAVEMQRRVAALPPTSGVSLGVKVGVCVGHAENEIRFFRDDGEGNAAVNLSRIAEPGQVLMSVPKRAKGFQWNALVAHSQPNISLKSGNRQLGVFELDWRGFSIAQMHPAAKAADAASSPLLYLRGSKTDVAVGPERPIVSIGRLRDCGLVLRGDKCSREHARIERRGEAFFLVDLSSNGSFIVTADGKEIHLHAGETELHGRGRIGFGQSVALAGDDRVDYSVGEPIDGAPAP